MENETNKDIFEIKLNETGKRYIQKFSSLGSIILIINVFVTLIIIGLEIYSLARDNNTKTITSPKEAYFLIYPYYSICYSIVALAGLYYYVLFFKKIKNSVTNSDELRFNLSFKYLYRNALIFLISMILFTLIAVFQVFVVFY